jgi:hypothetical protein
LLKSLANFGGACTLRAMDTCNVRVVGLIPTVSTNLINDWRIKIMGNLSSKRKSEFLGIPHGTASNKLRKLVLFSLLERHKENVCFRCSAIIETVEELSLEHKLPWENISVELFWDLNNVAFSHMKCNRPHNPKIGVQREFKGGKFKCSFCGEFKFPHDFNICNERPSKRKSLCKKCIADKGYYKTKIKESSPNGYGTSLSRKNS